LEYPAHFKLERVYPNGVISLESTQFYLSGCLTSELVGLEEIDDGRWKVHFGPLVLGFPRSALREGPWPTPFRNAGSLRRRDHSPIAQTAIAILPPLTVTYVAGLLCYP
jgi:hypothetical protein